MENELETQGMSALGHSRLHLLIKASEDAEAEVRGTDVFCEEAPIRMSRYQIEQMLLGSEPPVGRYHQACVEIRKRAFQIRAIVDYMRQGKSDEPKGDRDVLRIEGKIQELNGLREELALLKMLAEKYKPLTGGRSYEDLQPEYWDERKCYDLAVALLCNRIDTGIVKDVMLLHHGSMARRFLDAISNVKDEADVKKLNQAAHMYLKEYDCFGKTDVTRPKLLAG